jgi:ATP phosphoribosyltransferase regulatory subunit
MEPGLFLFMVRCFVVNADRWLLPDGIGEVLPGQAAQLECLRRRLLDLYSTWGYELIIPPLMEFTESLLIGNNRDLDLQTFKVTDQLSGRTMGIRADITPQAARIDAHSLNRKGPVRLCYAGTVLHTRPANALASRSPVQVGVECFGIKDLMADIEVISLMAETLGAAHIKNFTLSLGHVDIFRVLTAEAKLRADQIETLLDILQRKAAKELAEFFCHNKCDAKIVDAFTQLIQLHGDVSVLSKAREQLGKVSPSLLSALAELEQVATQTGNRYADITIHIDLAELPGYHYHNGIVFAAYVEGAGAALANGGRYDAVGAIFGRARPATGFNADLKTILSLSALKQNDSSTLPIKGIVAEIQEDPLQWRAIAALRERGERVICVTAGKAIDFDELGCNRQLVREKNQYVIKPV